MDISIEALIPEIERWGYWIVLVMTFLENSAFAGLVAPGEVTLVIAGLFASRGSLDLPWLYAAAISGALAGDITGYMIGRHGGYRFLRRYGRFFFFREEYMDRTRRYFQKHGGKTVFVGRFVSVVKVFAPMTAGIARMPFGRFIVYDGLGAILANSLLVTAGYFFGESWSLIDQWIGWGGGAAFVVVIAAVAILLFVRWKRRRAQAV